MDNVEIFLDLEKEAEKLSESIINLYKEIGSYKEAKTDFSKTAEELLKLIEKTEELSLSSHSIISKMNEIGMPELLNTMETTNANLLEVKKITSEIAEKNKITMEKLELDNQQINVLLESSVKRINLNTILIGSSIFLTVTNLIVLFVK